jgi:hypothetical protein
MSGRQEVDWAQRIREILVPAFEILIRDELLRPDRDVFLESLKIKLPAARHGEWLLVLSGSASDGTPMVAFMGGDELSKALRRAMEMYDDGSLRWKVDEWRLKNARKAD